MPNGVSSPCGEVTSTTDPTVAPISSAMSLPRIIGGIAATRCCTPARSSGDSACEMFVWKVTVWCGAPPRPGRVELALSGVEGTRHRIGIALFQRRCRSRRYRLQQIADLSLILRQHSFQHRPACPRPARNQHLLVNRRSCRHHMRLLRQFFEQRTPIAHPVALYPQQADVRRRTQQPRLQILPKSVIDGQRDNQRSHSRRHAQDRDAGDDANKRLPPFGAQISSRNEKFEAHRSGCQLSAISFQLQRIIAGARRSAVLRDACDCLAAMRFRFAYSLGEDEIEIGRALCLAGSASTSLGPSTSRSAGTRLRESLRHQLQHTASSDVQALADANAISQRIRQVKALDAMSAQMRPTSPDRDASCMPRHPLVAISGEIGQSASVSAETLTGLIEERVPVANNSASEIQDAWNGGIESQPGAMDAKRAPRHPTSQARRVTMQYGTDGERASPPLDAESA